MSRLARRAAIFEALVAKRLLVRADCARLAILRACDRCVLVMPWQCKLKKSLGYRGLLATDVMVPIYTDNNFK